MASHYIEVTFMQRYYISQRYLTTVFKLAAKNEKWLHRM